MLLPRLLRRVFVPLALTCLTAPVCAAATLYVSPSGNDNTGSPYRTIQAAVNNASSGDTISLASGTYSGAGNRDIDANGKSLIPCGSIPRSLLRLLLRRAVFSAIVGHEHLHPQAA